MADELEVRLNDRLVGMLRRTRKGGRFTFDPKLTEEAPGLPLLSTALLVKARPYSEGLTGAWFAGLLPEGERLNRICREIGCETTDYIGILEHIGWECAGAVSVCEPGFDVPSPGPLHRLSQGELATRLRLLSTTGGDDNPVARVSLGGYQEKLVVVADGAIIERGHVTLLDVTLPDAATVSTHILKPQPAFRHAGVVEGEAWAMAVASVAARCARCALLELDDAPQTLVVERFDRIAGLMGPMRIHQEDCCQAMGLAPSGKYASERQAKGSDPSYSKIAALLMRYSSEPEAELAELLRQMSVNLILGNTDAHAKNYALLYRRPCVPSLSPLYDVVPVCDVEPRARILSMRVHGIIEADKVLREDVLAEAVSWGMSISEATTVLDTTLAAAESGIELARPIYPRAAKRHERATLARMGRLM